MVFQIYIYIYYQKPISQRRELLALKINPDLRLDWKIEFFYQRILSYPHKRPAHYNGQRILLCLLGWNKSPSRFSIGCFLARNSISPGTEIN